MTRSLTLAAVPAAIALSVAMLGAAAPATAQAAENRGVSCPSGFDPVFSNSGRTLQCRTQKSYTLHSICLPGYNMDANGSDECLPPMLGKREPSRMTLPQPGWPDVSTFRRVVSQTAPDVFVSTRTEYAFPIGGPLYIGHPAVGVSCADGQSASVGAGGRGLVCRTVDLNRSADCDLLWSLLRDHNGGAADRCVLANQVGSTKPAGMTKIQLDAENALAAYSWRLLARAGGDLWQRTRFSYPAVR